jgi:deoxyribonuclease V
MPDTHRNVFIQEWKRIQDQLSCRVIVTPLKPLPRFIAGTDAAFSSDGQRVFAVAVVYDRHQQSIVEVEEASQSVKSPYIPGFLSFREGETILEAIGRLRREFGAVLFDGHGVAHPRRCGIASHLAVLLDCPGVGVAKSRLIGHHDSPGLHAGAAEALMEGGEQIGLVLRTRAHVKPVFVSIGHRVDLETAKELVLACCTRFRLPEPTRHADIEVKKLKGRHS